MHLPGRRQPIFSPDEFEAASRFFDAHAEIGPTPLVSLPALARSLGLGSAFAKDESARGELSAFKLLGARFAVTQAPVQVGEIGQQLGLFVREHLPELIDETAVLPHHDGLLGEQMIA